VAAVTAPAAGAHGGDAWRLAEVLGVGIDDIVDLSASLNPVARDPAPLVRAHLGAVRRYPADHRATAALAEAIGTDPARVVLTNGGAEAIALLAGLWPTGWVEDPDFSLYRRHLDALEPGAPRWRSDPHNPTGRLAPPDQRWEVRDEAFYPLATGTWTRGDGDAVVVGSLTKLFACPGLRLGYLIAPDDSLASRLRDRRPAWAVNGLATEVLPDLLAGADLPGWAAAIAQLRAELAALLHRYGYRPEPSDANYVWIPHAAGLRDRLAPQRVLVRCGASFGAPDAVRIGVPGPDGLAALERALHRSHHDPPPPAVASEPAPAP
jgi:histidinol-phosphate/aromatic aminotransferase/cobyric acid decarboxylase-like protein